MQSGWPVRIFRLRSKRASFERIDGPILLTINLLARIIHRSRNPMDTLSIER
jgi:hypothetical protein